MHVKEVQISPYFRPLTNRQGANNVYPGHIWSKIDLSVLYDVLNIQYLEILASREKLIKLYRKRYSIKYPIASGMLLKTPNYFVFVYSQY